MPEGVSVKGLIVLEVPNGRHAQADVSLIRGKNMRVLQTT